MNKNQVQEKARNIVESGEVHTDKGLAMIIWDARFESQQERDINNGIYFDDYVSWVSEINK